MTPNAVTAPDGSVSLLAEFTARPGTRDTVEEMISAYGTVVFVPTRSAADPDHFVVFEIYRDAKAFEDHIGAAAGQAFNHALHALIVEPRSHLTWLISATPSP